MKYDQQPIWPENLKFTTVKKGYHSDQADRAMRAAGRNQVPANTPQGYSSQRPQPTANPQSGKIIRHFGD